MGKRTLLMKKRILIPAFAALIVCLSGCTTLQPQQGGSGDVEIGIRHVYKWPYRTATRYAKSGKGQAQISQAVLLKEVPPGAGEQVVVINFRKKCDLEKNGPNGSRFQLYVDQCELLETMELLEEPSTVFHVDPDKLSDSGFRPQIRPAN